MKKFLFSALLIAVSAASFAQKVTGKLVFEQGQTLVIYTEVKNTLAQQANGQSIDFNVNGASEHSFRVSNATEDNTTLHHKVASFKFAFDGMGAKKSFDSDNKKDMESSFGKPVKEMLAKDYSVIIDGTGKALMSRPEKIDVAKSDDQLTFITGMLPELTAIIHPPRKGSGTFFQVLPGQEVGVGDKWTETTNTESERSTTEYTLAGFTDSTILVDFVTNATIQLKSEMRGMPITSNLKATSTGKIILDKATQLVKEKTTKVESTGTAEIMGTSTPVSAKTTITARVSKEEAAAEGTKK